MIRILRFEDGARWIARLRMHLRTDTDRDTTINTESDDNDMQREVDCLRLMKERTSVPVPTVFAYIPGRDSKIGIPFMLMECIHGNVGVDLYFSTIPPEHKSSFYEEMARIQTEI